MNPKEIAPEAVLESLRKSVAKALDRKKRLGQYAVVWQDGEILKLDFSHGDEKVVPFNDSRSSGK